jgi:hypothetical protein
MCRFPTYPRADHVDSLLPQALHVPNGHNVRLCIITIAFRRGQSVDKFIRFQLFLQN